MSQQWEHLGEMSANDETTHTQQTEKNSEIHSSKRAANVLVNPQSFLFDIVECV